MPIDPIVAGIRISHPDRIVYPELGVTKLELAQYYARIGPWILQYVQGRPLTLVHCPQGMSGSCRFMNHSKLWGPDALRRRSIQEKTKVGDYMVARRCRFRCGGASSRLDFGRRPSP
jgi:bifunctional non-homologous end joining protein LigD